MKSKWLGIIGVWLCDRYFPRPCTKAEIAHTMDYVNLMINVLKGEVPYYGRDAARAASVDTRPQ